MEYPGRLIPLLGYKKIEIDLSSFFLCRAVNNPDLLEKQNGLYPDEMLCSEGKELFDYSTNLISVFLPEDNKIVLLGNDKKYFYSYWDFEEEVNVPVFKKDFEVEPQRGFFFFPIAALHKRICLPLPSPPKEADETLTSYVVHTPTRSNYWHFSICWKDKNGNFDHYKGSTWQKRISVTMRHSLQEYIHLTTPEFSPLPASVYME